MKKSTRQLAWILSASMAASMVPVFGTAQAAAPTGVTLKGRYETSIPVKVEYQAAGDVSIQWEISDNGQDGWTAISGATSATYTPDKGKGLKWLRAAVTADETTAYSAPKQLKDRWYGKKQGNDGSTAILACTQNDANKVVITTMNSEGAIAESNPECIFKVDDAEYLLLDVTEDDNSHFLVLRKKAIGRHNISTGGQLMDEIMSWLNDKESIEIFRNNQSKGKFAGLADYTNNGYRADMNSLEPQYAAISESILNHIDENAIWKQEAKMWEWGDCEITYSGGITIPAITDYERYIDKIGWKDFVDTGNDTGKYMAFRTGHGNQGDGSQTLYYDTDWAMGNVLPNYGSPKTINGEYRENKWAVRPMFFLDKDFFLDSEIVSQMDFNSIGSDVKAAIANSASIDELIAAGYNEADLAPYIEKTGELSDITTDGLFETSLPMTLKYTYSGNELRLKFNMYVSDTENGEYTLAKTQTGDNVITIPVSAGDKYVKFSVETTDGIVKWTNPHYINPAWGKDVGVHPEYVGKEVDTAQTGKILMERLDVENKTTPSEYIFTVGDMEFIMLDVTESDSSKFFVMSKNIVDGEQIPLLDKSQGLKNSMDFLNSTNGVNGYMPNGEYLGRTDADGLPIDTIFPDEILANINYNQVWKRERPMYNDFGSTELTVTGGITFPAMHELRQYSQKIGLWDNQVRWWTRTPYGGTGSGDTMIAASHDNFGAFFPFISVDATSDVRASIRPVFYLDKSMFTDKVYDLSAFGAEALSALRKAYTREELAAAGYSEETLKQYYDIDGELTAARIDGIYETSLPVSVDFDYSGNNLDNIKINWYISDTADGEFKALGSVSGKDNNFRLPYSAGGKYIKGEAVCIPTGTSFMTEARYVEAEWGPQAAINEKTVIGDDGFIHGINGHEAVTYPNNSVKGRVPNLTPAEYTFSYDGKEYILLDTTESSASHYLVMLKTPEVMRKFNDGGQLFDDMIGWLNDLDVVNSYAEGKDVTTVTSYKGTGFLSTSSTLPDAIKNHINWKNNWKVEQKMWNDDHERVYEGGIAIPAYKEVERYAEKIGMHDMGYSCMWFRTPNGVRGHSGDTLLCSAANGEFTGFFSGQFGTTEYYIRPTFYLDDTFFTTVKVENIGAETAALIREDVPKEDMIASGLYSDIEIEEIYKENVPVEEDYIKAEWQNVAEGGTVTATIKTNIPSDDIPRAFIAAVYNESGKLIGVNFTEQVIAIDTENPVCTFDIAISNVAAGSGNYAKVFVWDNSVSDMYPLYEAIQ